MPQEAFACLFLDSIPGRACIGAIRFCALPRRRQMLIVKAFDKAERDFDPRRFGLWAQHANHCATPLQMQGSLSDSLGAAFLCRQAWQLCTCARRSQLKNSSADGN